LFLFGVLTVFSYFTSHILMSYAPVAYMMTCFWVPCNSGKRLFVKFMWWVASWLIVTVFLTAVNTSLMISFFLIVRTIVVCILVVTCEFKFWIPSSYSFKVLKRWQNTGKFAWMSHMKYI